MNSSLICVYGDNNMKKFSLIIITLFLITMNSCGKIVDIGLEEIIEENKVMITDEIYSIISEAEKVRYNIHNPKLEIVNIEIERADCIFSADWEWIRKAEDDPMILGMHEAKATLTDEQEIAYADEITQGWISEIECWYGTERIETRIVIKQDNDDWILYFPHVEDGQETLYVLSDYAATYWTEDFNARKQNGIIIINEAITLLNKADDTPQIVTPTSPTEDIADNTPIESPVEDFDISIDETGNVILNKYNGDGGDVVIPNSVTHIGDHAFDMILNTSGITITSIFIPDSVVSIGDYAFLSCYSLDGGLTSVRMSANIRNIGEQAFQDCQYLSEVILESIPEHTIYISNQAFAYCPLLTRCDMQDCLSVEYGDDVYINSFKNNE